LISLDSTLKTASGNCALASANFSGENTTRLSGGFFRSFIRANFIYLSLVFFKISNIEVLKLTHNSSVLLKLACNIFLKPLKNNLLYKVNIHPLIENQKLNNLIKAHKKKSLKKIILEFKN